MSFFTSAASVCTDSSLVTSRSKQMIPADLRCLFDSHGKVVVMAVQPRKSTNYIMCLRASQFQQPQNFMSFLASVGSLASFQDLHGKTERIIRTFSLVLKRECFADSSLATPKE